MYVTYVFQEQHIVPGFNAWFPGFNTKLSPTRVVKLKFP